MLDPIFNGDIEQKFPCDGQGELEREVKIKLPGNKEEQVKAVKKFLLAHANSKGVQIKLENTVNWITPDYCTNQKQYIAGVPQKESLFYQKKRIGASPDNVNGISLEISKVKKPQGGAAVRQRRYGATGDDVGMRLDVQWEVPIDPISREDIVKARARSRISLIGLYKGWRIDISLTYTANGSFAQIAPKISMAIKEWLFTKSDKPLIDKSGKFDPAFLASAAWFKGDLEIEAEYIGESTKDANGYEILTKGPLAFASDLSSLLEMSEAPAYQNAIWEVAKMLKLKNAGAFKSRFGLKQLGVQVSSLGRREFLVDLRFRMEEFTLTHKADGLRCILVLHPDGTIELIAGSLVVISPVKPQADLISAVLDGELLPDGRYLAFDCLYYGTPIWALPLEDRLAHAESAMKDVLTCRGKVKQTPASEIKSSSVMPDPKYCIASGSRVKHFTFLTKENWVDSWRHYMKKTGPDVPDFETDGIIVTPKTGNYFGADYIVYKQKPREEFSIDFFVKTIPDNENVIYLMNGIKRANYIAMRHPTFPSWSPPEDNTEYFPMPFSPSINPNAYRYVLTKEDKKMLRKHFGDGDFDISRKILEMGYYPQENPNEFPKFKLLRIREDREDDLARGTYFGNNYFVAEDNYTKATNPLTLEDIRFPEQGELGGDASGYFQKINNERYKSARNFNSAVKEQIFAKWVGDHTPMVLDLASGQGQDLRRWFARADHLVCVERDANAVNELVKRKWDLVKANSGARKTSMRVVQADLMDEDTPLRLKTLAGIGGNCTSIHCGFAAHYFCGNTEQMRRFVDIIGEAITPNGTFFMTCFNAERVLALVRGGPWVANDDQGEKYRIEYDGKVPTKVPKVGGKIRALLPFSGGQLYEEFLVNFDELDRLFKKHGMTRMGNYQFTELVNPDKFHAELSEADKQFCSLYETIAWRKNAKPKKSTGYKARFK